MDYAERLKLYGNFFYEHRVARGLTLKEAAGTWSPSTLSRFERGEIDISSERAFDLIQRLGLVIGDFTGLYDLDAANFPLRLDGLVVADDAASIDKLARGFFAANPRQNAMTELARVLFDMGKNWADPAYRLTPTDEQIVADRVAQPERMGPYEMQLLKPAVAAASHEFLTLQLNRTKRLVGNRHQYQGIYAMLYWLGALMNRDHDFIRIAQPIVDEAFASNRENEMYIEFVPNYRFGLLMRDYLAAPTDDNTQRITRFITDVRAMGGASDGDWYEQMFRHLQAGAVHHNPALADHASPFVETDSTAEKFRAMRQYMGLSIEDFSDVVSASTLRRFEAGQTELSFLKLMILAGRIGIFVPQLIHDPGTDTQHYMGFVAFGAAYAQVSRVLPPEADRVEPAEVLVRFERGFDRPKAVLQLQKFILTRAANPPIAPNLADQWNIEQVQEQIMSSSHWGLLDLLCLLYLVPSLDAAQMMRLFLHGSRQINQPSMPSGSAFYFQSLAQAWPRIVAMAERDAVRGFLRNMQWVFTVDIQDDNGWLAMAGWLIARNCVTPTADNRAAVTQYVRRALFVGHDLTVPTLTKLWAGLVPDDLFDASPLPPLE